MTDNIPSFKELKASFDKVYDGPSDLQREISLVGEAERLKISIETYRNYYKFKDDEEIEPYPKFQNLRQVIAEGIPKWCNWFGNLPKDEKKVLFYKGVKKSIQGIVSVGFVIGLVQFVAEAPTRKKQAHYQAWQMINGAASAINGGVTDALQDLNKDQVSLKNVFLSNKQLDQIDLSGADLELANFASAILFKAKLKGAILKGANLQTTYLFQSDLERVDMSPSFSAWHQGSALMKSTNLENAVLSGANLECANLDRVNLKRALLDPGEEVKPGSEKSRKIANLKNAFLINADLTDANLQEASLIGASFASDFDRNGGNGYSSAKLKNANLQGADITDANFVGVTDITPEQIQSAKNWEKAHYDPSFRQKLGLPEETTSNERIGQKWSDHCH